MVMIEAESVSINGNICLHWHFRFLGGLKAARVFQSRAGTARGTCGPAILGVQHLTDRSTPSVMAASPGLGG
jgi:hypothetical protein